MTTYFKVSGGGNDFLALVEPPQAPGAESIRAWCRRGLSLGADGLFCLARGLGGARMTYYNADGGRSELCLNGSRCAAQLAFHLGWAERELILETDAGALAARRLATDRVSLELPPVVTAGVPEALAPGVDGVAHHGFRLDVGVPHFVLLWAESLARAPVAALGPLLRRHPDFGPPGANVDFVRYPSKHTLEVRSFERGVEQETLACGTGVVAAVLVGRAVHGLELPATALTGGGCELEVATAENGRLVLAGDARILASGEILAGAGQDLPDPRWSP